MRSSLAVALAGALLSATLLAAPDPGQPSTAFIPLVKGAELRLAGPLPSTEVFFQLPGHIALAGPARLTLRFRASQLLLASVSTATVEINGTPIRSIRLPSEAGEDGRTLEITVPSGLLRIGWNTARVHCLLLTTDVLCRDVDNPACWFVLDKGTGITVPYRRLELFPEFARPEAFAGLAGFSHLWLVFIFHEALAEGWRPTVRPPKLGGRRKVGVFASRSPHRPNPIGLSAVAFLGFDQEGSGLALRLGGVDLLDGTPVLDVKPYIPYADALPQASSGFVPAPPALARDVTFSPLAQEQLRARDPDGQRRLSELITQILRQDPRPGYLDRYPERQDFALRLYDLEVKWRETGGQIEVTALEPCLPGRPKAE